MDLHTHLSAFRIAYVSVQVLIIALVFVVVFECIRMQLQSTTPLSETFDNYTDKPRSHTGEFLEPITSPPPNTVFVFWTGGFDSTFRVLQAVIDEGHMVQPFYLSGDIDNAPTKRVKRKNKDMELLAMQRVRNELCKMRPDICSRLLPTIIVDDIPIHSKTKRWMRRLAKHRVVRRPTCQYGSLGQFSRYMQVPIELGIVQDGHSNAGIYSGLTDKVIGRGRLCRIKRSALRNHPEYALFRSLRFPLMHIDKPEMWKIANTNGYGDLMRLTWSCWYPTADGKPCNKCLMCRERILKTV
jgi:hypothetical protein